MTACTARAVGFTGACYRRGELPISQDAYRGAERTPVTNPRR